MGGGAGKIPDSGSGIVPGDSNELQILKFGAGWMKRRLQGFGRSEHSVDSIVTNGSWPNLGWCIRNSECIARTWHEAPKDHRDLLNGVVGRDLWEEDLDAWSRKSHDCFRILTMLNWLRVAS
jgi:asparagine synthase (glutamine-hydrolysing)